MRVQITVTDDEGKTFEGEVDLPPAGTRRGGARRARNMPATPAAVADAKVDFKLPLRAFLKKHATGGGPQKFAVLLAHMTGGKTGVQVTREAIEAAWTRNKGVLGVDYHTMYGTRSTGEGWSDSPKRGTFVLLPDWREALK
ncbi:MAG: hypothetical protein DMD29_03315 [Gemmatimonadetes bacterium]|nr:MAG: hypothetical protein DMD29_03315 [Gemmatimonadota bacterium]